MYLIKPPTPEGEPIVQKSKSVPFIEEMTILGLFNVLRFL
jgi:hypothetical protein